MASELRGRKLKVVSLLVPRSVSKILILTVQNNPWKRGEGKKRHRSRLPLTTAAGSKLMSVFKDSLERVSIS